MSEFRIVVELDPAKAQKGAAATLALLVKLEKQANRLRESLKNSTTGMRPEQALQSTRRLGLQLNSLRLQSERLKDQLSRAIRIDPTRSIAASNAIKKELADLQGEAEQLRAALDRGIKIDSEKAQNRIREISQEMQRLGIKSDRMGVRLRRSVQIDTEAARAKDRMRQLQEEMQRTNSQAKVLGRTIRTALGTAGVIIGVRELKDLVDTYQDMGNRLKVVTASSGQLADAQIKLLQIANDTRTSLRGTSELFARTALASRELGLSQQELLQFTESLNKAVIISGASSKEAFNAIVQLSQGIASGALRGDELRSVLEQLPVVADVIAKKLGVTRGELRKLGKEGVITAELIIEAFSEAEGELNQQFGKTTATLSQQLEVLKNNVIVFLGAFAEGTGIVGALGSAFRALGTILSGLGKIVSLVKGGIDLLLSVFGEFEDLVRTIIPVLLIFTGVLLGLISPFLAVAGGLTFMASKVDNARERFEDFIGVMPDAFLPNRTLEKFIKTWSRLGDTAADVAKFDKAVVGFINNLSRTQNPVTLLRTQLEMLGNAFSNVLEPPKKKRGRGGPSLRDQLNDMIGSVFPAIAAIAEMNEAEALLDRAVKRGIISQEEHTRILEAKRIQLEAQLDPIKAINDQLDREIELLVLSNEERRIQSRLFQFESQLRQQGITEIEAELELFEEKLRIQADIRAENALQIKLVKELAKAQEEAIKARLKALRLVERELNKHTVEVYPSLQESANKAFESIKKDIRGSAELLEETLTNAFTAAEDGLVEFLSNTEAVLKSLNEAISGDFQSLAKSVAGFFKSLVDGIIKDLTRLAIRRALLNVLGPELGIPTTGGDGGGVGAIASILNGGGGLPGFATGGSFKVGGGGSTDSEMVAFRATPGERVTVQTPAQQSGAAAKQDVNLQVINNSPEEFTTMLEGGRFDQQIVNIVARNRSLVQRQVTRV